MTTPNPEQFRGLDPGYYLRKKTPSRAWADQESVSYTYQDELGYGGTMNVSERTEREQPTMTRAEATVKGLDPSEAYNNDRWTSVAGADDTLSRDPVYDQVEGQKTEVGAQGQLFRTNPESPNPVADLFHGNYRGSRRTALLGVLAGVHERKNTGPLSVYTGMSELARNMVLKVGKAAERHGINFVANLDAQHDINPAANYTDEDRRTYSGSGRAFNENLEGGGRSEVPNAFYVNSTHVAPEGVEPEVFQGALDDERARQEARLTPQESYRFRGVATSAVREEAEMIKFSDSQVKESYDFLRSILHKPKPGPAPEELLRRHRIYDDPEDLESPSNRRSMTGQGALDFPEWTPLERDLTAGRNRARGELKAMARKSTRRPSQKEQPTMSQPAPTLRETVEELAADEEFAYSQGYDDAVSEGRFDDEVEESYSQGYGQGTTDSGVVDPVAEGAMYGETIDPDILGRRRPDRNPLG